MTSELKEVPIKVITGTQEIRAPRTFDFSSATITMYTCHSAQVRPAFDINRVLRSTLPETKVAA